MPGPGQRSWWQRLRRPFRWCRLTLWSLTLVLLGSFIYWDTVGLPAFVKRRLVTELQARGVVLDFTRLRLRWFRGLVAEAVSFAPLRAGPTARFSATEVTLKPDWAALPQFRFDVTALDVRNGRLQITLASTNEAPVHLEVNQIQTELRLLPDDRWELDRFDAESLGAKVSLQGVLTNASAVRLWSSTPSTNRAPGVWQSYLREAVRIAGNLRFSQPPQLRLTVWGDARQPAAILADASLDARDADTTWGGFARMSMAAHFNRPAADGQRQSEVKWNLERIHSPWFQAEESRFRLLATNSTPDLEPSTIHWSWEMDHVDTPWGSIPGARFTGRTSRSTEDPGRLSSEVELDSGSLRSDWVDFETNRFSARIIHPPAGLVPLNADWRWTVTAPSSRWAQASLFEISGQVTRRDTKGPSLASSDWAWWSLFEPYAITWSARLNGVNLTNFPLEEVSVAGHWQAPDLTLDRISARHNATRLDGSLGVNVGTRKLHAALDSSIDWRTLPGSLTEEFRPWAEPLQWASPPHVTVDASLTLPAWTNRSPDLKLEVLPSLHVTGRLDSRSVRFREFSVDSLQSHFAYSNQTLRLPDLTLTRPEGRAEFDFSVDLAENRYYCRLQSGIDPLALQQLFKRTNTTLPQLIQFSSPPRIDAEVWGRAAAPDQAAILAHLSATNFVFRGEVFESLSGSVRYTNRFVVATNVAVRAPAGTASAPSLGFDPNSGMLFLTNAVAFIDPQFVFRCINPILATNVSRYTFKQPPHAQVNGWIEVRQGRLADLRVDVSGGPFNYWRFNAPQISGTVLLRNEQITITNLAADFYGGRLLGDIVVASTATPNPDFRFAMQVSGTDLHQMMSDLSSPTNRLEGSLTGELNITRANAGDWKSWNGYGNARLRDGYLWDIPLFGVFSPVLNAIVPGLGQSRITAGEASYFITNSVIHTRDLQIRSPAMRLAYQGTIDFDYRVDARVEARLLRDMWVVGPVVSLVFSPLTKLMEYKVTGTLSDPKLEPLHLPKPLQFPLHPWRTLKDLFTNDKPEKPPENPPPAPTPEAPPPSPP